MFQQLSDDLDAHRSDVEKFTTAANSLLETGQNSQVEGYASRIAGQFKALMSTTKVCDQLLLSAVCIYSCSIVASCKQLTGCVARSKL
jgi:hypothetical protein